MQGRRQITSAERTNMWSVCLTSKGVLNYLNRRISPVGEHCLPFSPILQAAFRRPLNPPSLSRGCCCPCGDSGMRVPLCDVSVSSHSALWCMYGPLPILPGYRGHAGLLSMLSSATDRSSDFLHRCSALQSVPQAGQRWIGRAGPSRKALASTHAGSAPKALA